MSVRTTTAVTALVQDMRNADLYDVLKVVDASEVTTDEGSVPWIRARITIDQPTTSIAAKLQPGQPYVVRVGSPSWAWAMPVTGYTPSTDGTVELQLATFDTRLLTYTPIAVDRTCWGMQADVNTIWRYVVGKVFGSAPGDDGLWDVQRTDADAPVTPFRTYSALTNLAPNPRLSVDAAGWQATGSGGTLSRGTNASAAYPFSTYARLGIGTGATSGTGIAYVQSASFTTGRQYTFSMYGQVSRGSVGNPMSARLVWFDAAGNEVGGRSYATTRQTVGNWNQRFVVTAIAPVGAASYGLTFYAGAGAAAWGTGDVLYATGVMVTEGDGLDTDGTSVVPYFDGDAVNGTAGYNYTWQGTAGASVSARTPVVDRDQDSLTWKPGQTAYDFLEPILQSLGLRTFAYGQTESGRLVDNGPLLVQPLLALTTYQYSRRLYYTPIPDNQIALSSAVNLYDIDVRTAIGAKFSDGTPMYADAVVLHYTWTDSTGTEREAYDTYSFATTFLAPYVVEYRDTPFPGRGRAVNIYRRLASRRRLITATHRLAERIEPGVLMTITDPSLGGSGSVLGYVDSTSHDLTSGVSVTRIKDAVDYPTNAWLRQPAGKSWNAVPTGTSWNTFTP